LVGGDEKRASGRINYNPLERQEWRHRLEQVVETIMAVHAVVISCLLQCGVGLAEG